jgi:E3 ubiquitin-protein ligase listerin
MSKKQFKSQASSGRLGGFGSFGSAGFGSTQSSPLSYIQEPPDYSSISDANVAVAFKNLSKKDSTTKAKALEDIQSHISSAAEIEEGLLEAWVKLYPRLSIDSARRVRQLAHSLNGQICSKCGKRVAKHLSRITGPWLAGTYDNDRAAAKAAQDAFGAVFITPDKVGSLKQTFHSSIVEYCKEAVLRETVQTLSDERTVSNDDAEATYCRVVSTGISVITSLLTNLPDAEIATQQHIYDELFGDSKLWEFVTHSDPLVRRSVHRLVQCALSRQPQLIESHLKAVSTAYVYKGLSSDQLGSATDFLQTLTALTERYETIWTEAYSAKKPAISRFKQFLKRGSQSGNADFWKVASTLFTMIPSAILPQNYTEAKELLLAARDGVAGKNEKFYASAAWPAYYAFVEKVASDLSEEEREQLLDNCVMPLLRQYLQPSPETTQWAISGARAAPLVASAAKIPGLTSMIDNEWPKLANQLIETAKMSQPQQSKDFEKSQLHVASSGERWAAMRRELVAVLQESSSQTFLEADISIVKECIDLLRNRDGKPFGGAAVIEEIVKTGNSHLLQDSNFKAQLQTFFEVEDGSWVLWPCSRHLIRCLFALHKEAFFAQCFAAAVAQAFQLEPRESSLKMLLDLFPLNIPAEAAEVAKDDKNLHNLVQDVCKPGLHAPESELFLRLYQLGVLPGEVLHNVLSDLVASLSGVNDPTQASNTLLFFSLVPDTLLRDISTRPEGEHLLPSLLGLEQHSDELIANRAASVAAKLTAVSANQDTDAKFGVVLQNLERLSIKSLSVDAMEDLTHRLLGEERSIANPQDVLPNLETWTAALHAVIRPPKPSLALLSPLGGVVHLVQSELLGAKARVQADGEGLSQALRIAMYVAGLLRDTDLSDKLTESGEMRWSVVALLYLTVLLAEDNLSVLGTNALWDPKRASTAEPVVLDFITGAHAVLASFSQAMAPDLESDATSSTATSDYSAFSTALARFGQDEPARSPVQYYVALAKAKINADFFESHGYDADQSRASESILRQKRAGKDPLCIVACIAGLQQPLTGSQLVSRYCNELVADLTDLDVSDAQHEQKNLEQLIVLNSILNTQEDALATIAKQRLIFLVKRLVPALNAGTTSAITVEICKALTVLLPGMQDMYGEHWSTILAYILSFWMSVEVQMEKDVLSDDHVLHTNASLRFYATLRKLSQSEEPNDDLVDALKDSKAEIHDALIQLLKAANGASDEMHQPLMITHELLAREIARLPQSPLQDADELYPLLYTPSRPIQQAVFDLLHQHIPAAQEQVSLDAALDNKIAQLPDQLLSLIIEAPTLDALADASFDRAMPLPLQGYLYGWLLLLDHFNGSSFRVKTDYMDQLKEGTYMPGFLSFAFDFLGHSRGRPVDASKFDVREYIPDTEPSPEKDVQWLLAHLYSLALTHLPGLVKSYYLDIRSRQTSLAVESWTARYISPLIITASLQAVSEWAEKSVKEDPEYEKMTVKVGMRSKEVNVGYVVDEQTMAIKVILPEAYPLASAQVVGVNRVAVKEDKWLSWLRHCSIIVGQNGSIIDGLSVWRKNVTGALAGQSECAICYSVSLSMYSNLSGNQANCLVRSSTPSSNCRLSAVVSLNPSFYLRCVLTIHHSHLQAPVPLWMSLQVVQDQQREHLSAVPESFQFQLGVVRSEYWPKFCLC